MPRTRVEQHTGLEAVFALHKRAEWLSEASAAPIASATLAATGDHDELHLVEKQLAYIRVLSRDFCGRCC